MFRNSNLGGPAVATECRRAIGTLSTSSSLVLLAILLVILALPEAATAAPPLGWEYIWGNGDTGQFGNDHWDRENTGHNIVLRPSLSFGTYPLTGSSTAAISQSSTPS
jgi:hypothetical protein